MPASFDGSARVSRLSKKSLAATGTRSFGRGPAEARNRNLRGLCLRAVALDQQLRELRLRGAESPAVLFEHLCVGACRAQLLPLDDDQLDLPAQGLDGIHGLTVIAAAYENGRSRRPDFGAA